MNTLFKKICSWVVLLSAIIITGIHANAQSEMDYSTLAKSFSDPDYAKWGEVPLWWWEADSLNKTRLTWQLETLAAKGVKSVCPIQRSPGRCFPESFSDEWWEMVNYVHSECKRLGMHLWLYDQVGYGQYGWLEKAAAQVGETGTSKIKFYTVIEKNGKKINLELETGKLLDARAYPLKDNIACDEKSLDIKEYVENNHLTWTPPNTEPWKVAVSVAIPYRSFYMNEASADIFIQQLYQKIEDVVGAQSMGNSLAGVFQDEHPPTPRDIYTDQLADTFQVMFGYDIARAIPAQYFDVGPKTPKYRVDYFDAYIAIVEKNYWEKVYDWTHDKNLLTSHDNWGRKNIYHQSEGYIDYFRSQRWFSAPGFDDPGQRSMLDRNYYDAKIAASIARLYQRSRVWNEGFHSSGWGRTTNQTLSWLATTYAFGANLYDEHGLYYSLNASTWEHAAPDPHWKQPYWQYYHKISDWVARASYLMSQGHSVVDVAVNYPVTSLLSDLWKNDIDYNGYMKVSRMIYDAGMDNDIIDDQSIIQGKIQNGTLKIRGNQYQALVFGPQKTMRLSVLKKVLQLVQDGGTAIFYGQLPKASVENGRNDSELKTLFEKLFKSSILEENLTRISASNERGGFVLFLPEETALIPSFLSANIDRDFIGTGGDVFYTHRKTGKNHIYFIQNTEDKPVQLNARLRADGVPELWDPFTGEIQELEQFERKEGYTRLRLLLEGNIGSFIILNPNKSALKKESVFAKKWQNKEVDDYWNFSVIPTRNNKWGDFKWPPSNEKIGPEICTLKYKEEKGVDGIAQEWNLPGFNDLDWETVIYDQGPYWLVAEDIPANADVLPALLKEQETIEAGNEITINENQYPWDKIIFSKKTGTGAPASWGGHSGFPDGHYNKNFIKLKKGRKILFTRIYSPKEQQAGLNVKLRNHTPGLWVNGEKQPFTGSVGNLPLKIGYNNVLLDVPDGAEGMLYVQKEPPAIATMEGETANMEAPNLKNSDWIWVGNSEGAYFRKTFQLKDLPKNARVLVTGVSGFKLYINGKKVTEDIGPWATWQYPKSMDITPWLKQGENLVAAWGQFLKGMNVSYPKRYQGFILAIKLVNVDGTAVEVNTNAAWKGNTEEMKDWFLPEFDATNWPTAEVKGKAGDVPWGSDFLENAGSSTTPYRPLSVNLETPLLEVFDEMPGIDYDIKSESEDRWAWYRFEAPPGLKELTLPKNEARIWINGREIKAINGVVKIQNPPIGVSKVAIRLKMNRGQYAGAAFEEPVKLKLQGGKIKVGPWQEYALPTYSGIVSYKQNISFNEEEATREIVLDLGEVCVAAEVFVNDKSAGIKVASPFKYNISSLIKKGENNIEVRVANTLAPHFSFPRTTYNLGPVKSGLIGPVFIQLKR